jgi:alpha 1,2-mannosyltransferase
MFLTYLRKKVVITAVLASCGLILTLPLVTGYFDTSLGTAKVASYLPSLPSFSGHGTPQTAKNEESILESLPTSHAFWPQYYTALIAATPRCALPHEHIEAWISGFHEGHDPTFQDLIKLAPEDEAELKSAHTWFVNTISSTSFPELPFTPGTSGVVTSAGGEFLPEALVSIRMLRHTGSTLPVDVFLATPEEDEGELCTTVFPALNATCRILSTMLSDAQGGLPHRHNITRYQLKAFALMLSDFDNILWIDADQIPLVDPRTLLEAEPLKSQGMVIWPDYWYMTTSPLFYRIAGVTNIPHTGERPASETGQFMISKTKHWKTLLLATYYNFHGPSHYYKLLSQGAVGEGDKETFAAAAVAFDEQFYAIMTGIDTIGYYDGEDRKNTGMLQAHPGYDYAKHGGGSGSGWALGPNSKVPPAFLHDEQHKPNAGRFSKLWREDIKQRMWQPMETMIEVFGFDVEEAVWSAIVWTACGKALGGHVFNDWIGNDQVDQSTSVCSQAGEVYETMFGQAWKDDETAIDVLDVVASDGFGGGEADGVQD